jgi:hypothetical protein
LESIAAKVSEDAVVVVVSLHVACTLCLLHDYFYFHCVCYLHFEDAVIVFDDDDVAIVAVVVVAAVVVVIVRMMTIRLYFPKPASNSVD